MKTKCPSCESKKLKKFTFTEDGEEFDAVKCPKCKWWGSYE